MRTKIIFLDVEGTLNSKETEEKIPETEYTGIDNKYVKKLKEIVSATGAMICLTGDWRFPKYNSDNIDCSTPYLQKKLRKYGLRYVSTTPKKESPTEEINAWLETNNDLNIESWLFLGAYNGLSDEDVEKAINILNKGEEDGED